MTTIPTSVRAVAAAVAGAIALASAPPPAHAQAEALKISQLEQDLRDLRRTVEAQSRRLDALERGPRAAGAKPGERAAAGAGAGAGAGAPARVAADAPWLQAANWARVQPGMSELDVVARLGPPTSMRTSDDGAVRTLFWALEIGSSGFLGGNVRLRDRKVVAVETPTLR